MHFRLAPRLTTLDDLAELLLVLFLKIT